MRELILIKHASPQVEEGVPSHEWKLSEKGQRASAQLAQLVREHQPAIVVTSSEPKAIETGRIIADALKIPIETSDGLEEHDRSNVPMMRSREFISFIELFFREPDRLILGRETAAEALTRFSIAIDEVLTHHPSGNVAIVTHGTVLALFLADRIGLEGFRVWRQMGLPSFAALGEPAMALIERVDRIS